LAKITEKGKDFLAIYPIMVQLMEKRSAEYGDIDLLDPQQWSATTQDFSLRQSHRSFSN